MTNEELLAAIRQIVREEIRAGVVDAIEPDDTIVDMPDENARVTFKGTLAVNPHVKVISVMTLKQSLEGRIDPLTPQQLASIMMNCGCDENGNLQPIAFRGYGGDGPAWKVEASGQVNEVILRPTFFQPYRAVFGPAFKQTNDDRTMGSRSSSIATLVESVRNIGTLGTGDGSAFK